MSRETWALIKRNKNFNVHIYRRGLTLLILSLGLSCGLSGLIYYVHMHEPERDFYATSGITPPIQLKPMPTPNMSSEALLPPDPPDEDLQRIIPK
ncbi:type IVB secretion system protein IcmM/DotJ [Legionella pneumophila]|nr:type IVB secretion system protein IcmM/DotJ [Legionella pneumophila]